MAIGPRVGHDQTYMRVNAAVGASSMLGRAGRLWRKAPSWLRVLDDAYIYYTAALIPIVLIVASITGEDDFYVAALLGAVAFIAELLLGFVSAARAR